MINAEVTVTGKLWINIDETQYDSESELNQAIADEALLNLEKVTNFNVEDIELYY